MRFNMNIFERIRNTSVELGFSIVELEAVKGDPTNLEGLPSTGFQLSLTTTTKLPLNEITSNKAGTKKQNKRLR